MLTKKLLKSKKAISPILATLLLIVIAVAAIVVTYAWIMTYMSSAGHQAEVRLYKANVSFINGGSKKIKIDVGNSGDSDTSIVKIYIGTTTSSLIEQNDTSPSLPASLNAGSITSITVTCNWTASTTYYFKIVSSTGQTLEFPEQAPTS
ncbi:hypothetical protein DRO59_01885 [Candidatus Bathyarchaeota archaeon]|nr:MAG: hypothetical protein DRO59_01885 [Candidatus Bathyarchaeota archaeon]